MAPVSISVGSVAVAGSNILADGKASVTNARKRLPMSSHVHWEHMLAGVAGGVVSTVALHPLDLIKIRFQVNEGLTVARHRPQYNGILDAVRRIQSQEGIQGLYKGLVPNVWGAGMAWGFYFLFYNSAKTWMQESAQTTNLGPGHHMTAAAAAGVATLIITNPVWVAKTRLCLQYDQGVVAAPLTLKQNPTVVLYNGTIDCIYKIHKYEGVRGLYKGFIPGLFGVSHGALQFMAYEELKKMYNGFRERPVNTKFNTLEYLSFAALSKIFAASLTYPYQVVRSRLQDQHRTYTGLMDVLRQTWRNEGVFAFYKGLLPNLLRVTPACCITFIIYENMIKYLRPDTHKSDTSHANTSQADTELSNTPKSDASQRSRT